MKKCLPLLLLACLFALPGLCQTQKGTVLLGGNLAMGLGTNWGARQWNIRVNPYAGLFVRENLAVGFRGTGQRNSFGIGSFSSAAGALFARKYFGQTRWRPLVQLDGGYSVQFQEFDGGEPTTDTGAQMSASAGAAYFINENIAVESVWDYNRTWFDRGFTTSNFLFLVGFQIHLPPKRRDGQ